MDTKTTRPGRTTETARPRRRYQRWDDFRKEHFSPEQLQRIDRRAEETVMEMNLRALRKYRGVTQIQVSKLAEIAQPELSNAERRQDHLVSTLRRIVSAMGGELEVSAVFEDGKRIKLLGV